MITAVVFHGRYLRKLTVKGTAMGNKRILGCIADDFTGASDIASFLKKGGMRTVLYNGVPGKDEEGEFDASVIALKTRTQETKAAVSDSLAALQWLREQGCGQLYIKYCSTFDSTPQGNIGPIIDSALEKLYIPYTILCPALPVNGRTVDHGCLYVNGIPLQESHMKDHPLTPMWDCRIEELMRPQGKYPCLLLDREQMYAPDGEIEEKVRSFAREHEHFYIVPDFTEQEDAERIVALFGRLPLLTGGSGIGEALGRASCEESADSGSLDGTAGRALILAGSCSKATLGQIRRFIADGGHAVKMEPQALAAGKQTAETLLEAAAQAEGAALIYSSDKPENIRENQRAGKDEVSALLESTTGQIAVQAVERGYTRIIVAGGETSGAVTKALGFGAFAIGASVAPGVPVMIPTERPDIRLVLKSGNFGEEDFFGQALKYTGR